MTSPTQRPLPPQHTTLKKTDIRAPGGFEPAIPASERPQTHDLDRVATDIGAHPYRKQTYSLCALWVLSSRECGTFPSMAVAEESGGISELLE
jgi:predicted RecB family nuclease